MIYEVRTYTLRPGTTAEFEERYEKRLPSRVKHSKLGGFWHTEFGPLNQVVHVYPYDDLQHRTRVRSAMANDRERNAMPGGGEFIVAQEAEIVIPAPFMRELGSRNYGTGNVYEMRTYTYAPGDIPKVLDAWGKAIRRARSSRRWRRAGPASSAGSTNSPTSGSIRTSTNAPGFVRNPAGPAVRGRHRPVSARFVRKTSCWYRRPSRPFASQNGPGTLIVVIPAQAGIQDFGCSFWAPAFAGATIWREGRSPYARKCFVTDQRLANRRKVSTVGSSTVKKNSMRISYKLTSCGSPHAAPGRSRLCLANPSQTAPPGGKGRGEADRKHDTLDDPLVGL